MEKDGFNVALFLAIYDNKVAYENLLAHMSEQKPDFDREKTEHIMELVYEALQDDLPDGWLEELSESEKEIVRRLEESSKEKVIRDSLKLDVHDNQALFREQRRCVIRRGMQSCGCIPRAFLAARCYVLGNKRASTFICD